MFNFLKRNFQIQGIVQFDKNRLCICGDRVKWLDKLNIKTFTKKQANKKAYEILNNKYPEYKDYIQLY